MPEAQIFLVGSDCEDASAVVDRKVEFIPLLQQVLRLIVGNCPKALPLLLLEAFQLSPEVTTDIFAELHLFVQLRTSGFQGFVVLSKLLDCGSIAGEFAPLLSADSLLGSLKQNKFLQGLLLLNEPAQGFFQPLSSIEVQNAVHGLKVLLVALVAKEGFSFVFELPLPNQAFAAGGAPAYFAPVLV